MNSASPGGRRHIDMFISSTDLGRLRRAGDRGGKEECGNCGMPRNRKDNEKSECRRICRIRSCVHPRRSSRSRNGKL